MSEGNGEGKSRLDRIEEMIERYVIANEAAHDAFNREHKMLLTAQIIMTDNMNKLELKMAETTEKLEALIKVVDGIIQRPPAEGRQ